MAIIGLTTEQPEELASFDGVIIVETPDGKYDILRFPRGQVIAGATFWWGVARHCDHAPEVYATGLEHAMSWLAQRLLRTCF